MYIHAYHLDRQGIPEGFQVFEERLEVAGLGFRKEAAFAFAEANGGWLEFDPEPGNTHDPDALKVLGCSEDAFGAKRQHLGYVPKDVSCAIAKSGYLNQMRPRLLKTFVSDEGFVEILFQILGPKGKRHEYQKIIAKDPEHFHHQLSQLESHIHNDKYEEAITMLLELVATTEREARECGLGVAPWCYKKLAIVYRKRKQYSDEVAILERFEKQPKAPGVLPQQLADRLVRARKIRDAKGT